MNKNYLICTSAFPICTICNLCNIKVTGSACNSPSDIINIFTLQSLFIFKIYLFCIFIYDSIIIKNRALTIVSIPIIAGENLYNVYLLDRSDKKTYSIEAVPWDEVLGYAVDKASLSTYGNVKFAALVLYEITYFGFSEEQIQNTIKAFNDEETLYPKAGKYH